MAELREKPNRQTETARRMLVCDPISPSATGSEVIVQKRSLAASPGACRLREQEEMTNYEVANEILHLHIKDQSECMHTQICADFKRIMAFQ